MHRGAIKTPLFFFPEQGTLPPRGAIFANQTAGQKTARPTPSVKFQNFARPEKRRGFFLRGQIATKKYFSQQGSATK